MLSLATGPARNWTLIASVALIIKAFVKISDVGFK